MPSAPPAPPRPACPVARPACPAAHPVCPIALRACPAVRAACPAARRIGCAARRCRRRARCWRGGWAAVGGRGHRRTASAPRRPCPRPRSTPDSKRSPTTRSTTSSASCSRARRRQRRGRGRSARTPRRRTAPARTSPSPPTRSPCPCPRPSTTRCRCRPSRPPATSLCRALPPPPPPPAATAAAATNYRAIYRCRRSSVFVLRSLSSQFGTALGRRHRCRCAGRLHRFPSCPSPVVKPRGVRAPAGLHASRERDCNRLLSRRCHGDGVCVDQSTGVGGRKGGETVRGAMTVGPATRVYQLHSERADYTLFSRLFAVLSPESNVVLIGAPYVICDGFLEDDVFRSDADVRCDRFRRRFRFRRSVFPAGFRVLWSVALPPRKRFISTRHIITASICCAYRGNTLPARIGGRAVF